ncbi:MAG: hypothetical protein MUP33_02860, partial [Polaromonas sp.]|nr:hypothetical protein [Polaromonas sp.]
MHLLAGGSPAATHFSLLRQRKVSKRKATRLSGSLFFGDFLLAKQKKVTCRRASPGQQPAAKLTQKKTTAEQLTGASS